MDAQPRVQRHALPLLLTPPVRRAAQRPSSAAALLAAAALALPLPAAGAPGSATGGGPVPTAQEPAPHEGGEPSGRPRVDGGPPGAPVGGDTTPGIGRSELSLRLERLLGDPAFDRAHVGLKVVVAETGEVLFERAAEKRFTAASTAKLVTAAAALDRLGAGFRWRTLLVATGPVEDGVLRGDLWVVGGGDPGLDRSDLRRWASALRDEGVRRIAGDVVGDGRSLAEPLWGRGWMWDDLHLGWSIGVTALQLDDAGVRAWLVPGDRPGDPAAARTEGPRTEPPVELDVRTGPPGSRTRLVHRTERPGPATGRIEGWVPADADSVPLWMAPAHPTGELLDAFGRALRDSAVEVDGDLRRPRDGERPPRGPCCGPRPDPGGPAADTSAPAAAGSGPGAGTTPTTILDAPSDSLGAALAGLLAPSDNQTAEVLLRTLGREEGRGGTAREGLAVVREVITGWGVSPDAFSLADGSGLSRYDELAPAVLVRVLRTMWRSPLHDVFTAALAAPGEEGTLEFRLLDTAARDGLRAKTGSLSSVRGLAGFVEAGDGTTLIFALMIDGYGVPGRVAEGVRDLLVEQLSLHRRPVQPGRPGVPRRDGGDGDGAGGADGGG
jgi:D-alanyl-D-alanine carboxypeptidase/D-alanyl-D-alanine-endopeptidase (penicillin-binding protein 4)